MGRITACSAHILPGLLLIGLLASRTADAALLLFDDRDQFLQAINDTNVFFDDLADLAPGYYGDPIERLSGSPFEYTLGSTGLVGLMGLSELVTMLFPTEALQVDGHGAGVYAMAGEFGLTDLQGNSVSGMIQIGLQNGTIITRTVGSTGSFVGVIGVGEGLGSFTVGAKSDLSLVTASSMIIAAVPVPSSVALLLLAPLVLRRSRRL